ncbi:MAG: uracil-DNA glycosylase [Candidatus Margulisiibacteriota bacterium]
MNYEEIKRSCLSCQKCALATKRNKVVFSSGPAPCDIMLIGEGPGADEDEQGLPFVGRAGQLLTRIFESVGIERDKEIYITNIVKCRPPENRAPLKEETEDCYPYLEAQIEYVNPKILILTGSPACKVVLKNEMPMSKIRGNWTKLEGTDISVMPIFHPSYLLRNPSKEKGSPKWFTWQDMIEVKNALDCVRKVKALTQ